MYKIGRFLPLFVYVEIWLREYFDVPKVRREPLLRVQISALLYDALKVEKLLFHALLQLFVELENALYALEIRFLFLEMLFYF